MDIGHDTLVAVAKSFGLFYLIAMSIGVVIYAYRPSKKQEFDRAAKAILHDEDQPWQ
jgi:cytochrome c oxidase cbb3-type subunit 4